MNRHQVIPGVPKPSVVSECVVPGGDLGVDRVESCFEQTLRLEAEVALSGLLVDEAEFVPREGLVGVATVLRDEFRDGGCRRVVQLADIADVLSICGADA